MMLREFKNTLCKCKLIYSLINFSLLCVHRITRILFKCGAIYKIVIRFLKHHFVIDNYYDNFRDSTWTTILTMTRSVLEWEHIQAKASISSNFTYVWVSTLIAGLVALFLNTGLSLSVKVIETGYEAKVYMAYCDFYVTLIKISTIISLLGWILLYIKGISTAKAGVLCGIFIIIICGSVLFVGKNHTILIDCFFLIFFAFSMIFLMAIICDIKRRKAIIRLNLIEKRLKELQIN